MKDPVIVYTRSFRGGYEEQTAYLGVVDREEAKRLEVEYDKTEKKRAEKDPKWSYHLCYESIKVGVLEYYEVDCTVDEMIDNLREFRDSLDK